MRIQDDLKVEQKAPTTEDCYIPGTLLDGTDCKILLDTGVSRSFMSKNFYLNCPSLNCLHRFVSKNIILCNGHDIGVLFVPPVGINVQGLQFELYTFVSEIHDNIDMVIEIECI